MIRLNKTIAKKVLNTNKGFFMYNLNQYNTITEYILTNDYNRYKEKYQKFKVVSCVKNEILIIKN